jgi:hypothetical protein
MRGRAPAGGRAASLSVDWNLKVDLVQADEIRRKTRELYGCSLSTQGNAGWYGHQPTQEPIVQRSNLRSRGAGGNTIECVPGFVFGNKRRQVLTSIINPSPALLPYQQ